MDILLRILYTVLVLGLLIFIHEFGHFITAKAFGVRVTEFALGMGPKILKKQGKETLYSLRLFPIGGFCAMTGEDEEIDDDPKAMRNKPVWQRMIIVVAGAAMNLLLGLIFVAVIVCFTNIPSTTVAVFDENASSPACGLQEKDEIIGVNGNRISGYTEMISELSRCYNETTVSLTVLRNGQEVILENVTFPTEQIDEDLSFPMMDFRVYAEKKTVGTVIKHTFLQTAGYATSILDSLGDMITGRVSLKYVSGPIGISETISEAASDGILSLMSIAAFISINLGIMNLLPLPALDGGRFLFMVVEAIIRRPVPAKVEGIIHGIGLILLLALMAVIAFKDLFFPV